MAVGRSRSRSILRFRHRSAGVSCPLGQQQAKHPLPPNLPVLKYSRLAGALFASVSVLTMFVVTSHLELTAISAS